VALLAIIVVGSIVLIRGLIELEAGGLDDDRRSGGFRRVAATGVATAVALAAAAFLPEAPIVTLTSLPVEPIALVVGLALGWYALGVIGARDPRRFAGALVVAAAAWFAVWYPNIAALPLPSTVVNAYQGLLPTYLYAFQFPVSTVDRNVDAPLLSPTMAVLVTAITVTCLVVAYSAWVWRITLAESRAAAASDGSSGDGSSGGAPADGLARSGGEA
jgi:hypothetical protein